MISTMGFRNNRESSTGRPTELPVQSHVRGTGANEHNAQMNTLGRDDKSDKDASRRPQVSASPLGIPLSALSPRPEPERETLQERPGFSVKRLVVLSTAGIIVTGLVFVIVLVPLLNSKELPDSRSTDIPVSASDSDSDSEERFSRKTSVFLSQENSNRVDNALSDEEYYEFLITGVEKAMNLTADPCHDFYEYACGRWGVHNPPPQAVARWSNFDNMTLLLWSLMEVRLKQLSNDTILSQRTSEGDTQTSDSPLNNALPSVRALMIDYYKSCENEELLSQKDVVPLKGVLNQMDQMYTTASQELQPLQAFQKLLEFVHHDLHVYAFFSWKVETDNKIRDAMAIELNVPPAELIQQGTELEGKTDLIRAYGLYAKTLLELVGTFNSNSLDNEVSVIVEFFETFHPIKGSPLVNRTGVESLDELAPILEWQKYFNSAFNRVGVYITKDEQILSQVQDYLAVLSRHILLEISTHGVERLYVYLRWQVIQSYSQILHKPARNAILPLVREITKVNTTISNFRLRPCVKEVVERLPLATSHLLLEIFKENLPETTISDNIQVVTEMADVIREEYIKYIDSFTWLEANAKSVLLEKLSKVAIKVGYPPIVDNPFELHDYFKNLTFNEDFFTNQMALLKFNRDNHMKLLRQPHLYSEWQVLSPLSVISFYLYRRNALLIPLGGLLHPVYSTRLPVYLAYATMGTLISHELGHSVDFVGRTRDMYGRVNITMWDEKTVEDFVKHVTCRVEQYSQAYYPIQGLQTISEVMADDPSVQTAFMAGSTHLQHHQLPATISNFLEKLNLSSEQLFFLYYAQMFCSTSSPENPLLGIKHYPPDWARVTATLANTPQFKAAFSCQKGTALNPDIKECKIW